MPTLSARPQPAPATGTTQLVGLAPGAASLPSDATASGPRRRTRGARMERRVVIVGGVLLAGVVGSAVLAGSLSDALTARAALAQASAQNAALRQQVEAGRQEATFADTPSYLSFAARSFGYGRPRERPFAVAVGGPPPPSITPLGDAGVVGHPSDALSAVLDLLFER